MEHQSEGGFSADVRAAAGSVEGAPEIPDFQVPVEPQPVTLEKFITDENMADFLRFMFGLPGDPLWVPEDAVLLKAAPPIRDGVAELLDKLLPTETSQWLEKYPAITKMVLVAGTLVYVQYKIVRAARAEEAERLAALRTEAGREDLPQAA